MILSRDYVGYLCHELVEGLAREQVKLGSPEVVFQKVREAVMNEMTAEDRLNDEVRALLERHAATLRDTGASYQESFKRVKRQLLKERNVVPASGRDSGEGTKVAREKIIKLSHVVVDLLAAMKKEVELRAEKNDVRLEIVRLLNELLRAEEKMDQRVRYKILSQKRQIVEGSQEWDILYRKYYSEEMKKLGVN